MEKQTATGKWSENIILVDADYVDRVTFDLIVNFERIIGRRIPPADLARWLDCIALDGGLREGENEVQVILVHEKDRDRMDNFQPSDYASQLDGKAFKDHLGEFAISVLPVEEMVSKEDFLLDILHTVCTQKEVRRVMLVADTENKAFCDDIRHGLRNIDDEKRITVFGMQPLVGGGFRQEILGYSLMNALGIRSDEIPAE